MKKLHLRLIACLLLISVSLVNSGFGAVIQTGDMHGDDSTGFTIIKDDGNVQKVDETWVEDYPYGIFALGKSELLITEGGEEQVLKVYRLGGTSGKASAIIHYQPAVTKNEDDSYDYSSAISAEDIIIEVEDPLPITEYQEWGIEPDPDKTDRKIIASQGVDGQGAACTILSLDLDKEAEAYQWYSLNNGEWTEVKYADGPELPVGEEELKEYDFRCVFTVDEVTYCTDSYKGEAYIKPEEQEVAEAPENIELNPEPTYSQLKLSDGTTPYDGFLFEVCFAQGEYEKKIHIRAKDDETAELDEYAAITITESIGGQVLESLNTLMLRLMDNDEAAEPSKIGFAITNAEFDKADGKALLTVVRSGDITKALSVDWTLADGTASAGIDYVGDSGTLYFYGSQTEQTIEIDLINNKIEDYNKKQFTVRLSNLLGDDASVITDDLCTVFLYNSNKADELNLASTLYDVDAVDVSGRVAESSGAPVISGVITGRQSTGSDSLDVLSDNSGVCTVDWGRSSGEEMEALLKQYGKINFAGGNWGNKVTYNMSVSSNGKGDKTSITQNVPNIAKLYKSLSAYVYGGAKFASGWDRLWHGDKEYAYTYFTSDIGGALKRWDCEPEFSSKGLSIYLYDINPFYVSHSWNYGSSSAGSLKLGVDIYDSCGSDGNINASTSVSLTRRTFNNDFNLNIYTANDSDMAQSVAKYNSNNYSNIVKSVTITEGGAYSGKLYEGSTFKVELGNTHLKCTDAYIVDGSGTEVLTGSVSGNIITFSNVILDPNGTYTVRLVLERQQNIKINVTTSSKVDSTGLPVGGAAAANTAAYNLLKSKNTAGGMITVGYTQKSGKLYSTADPVSKKISIGTLDSASGFVTPELVTDLQYVNFNLSEDDVILFNGKAYAGNETIWLAEKDLTPKDIVFYFYEKEFLSAERPMKAAVDSIALYYDGNGNGKIDGYFNKDTNVFMVTAPDMFINYLSDGDYEETSFQPVVDSDGLVHQYFLRPYYTANPVCLVVPMGHSDSERMQVMPSFITDVTDSTAYEKLTAEQKQYRVIVSGKTILDENGAEKYSSDDHYKYTAAASAYSYIDIPLGGDMSPSRQMTNEDLKTDIKNGIAIINGTKYIFKNGLAYYYLESGPGGLGDAVYTWTPNYKGNLLYPFDNPSPIVIPHSLAGSNIPGYQGCGNMVPEN